MGDIARRQVPPTAADMVEFDPAVALDYLGLNPEEPRSHALLGICQRYSLDPLANHVIVIPGRPYPYVTRDGHLELAHRSGQLDGIQVLEEWQTEKHCWAKVAVHRKDMGHPFVYTGRAPLKMRVKGGGEAWDPNADKKAVANAEVRALKRAFPLQLPSVADLDAIDEERAATTVSRAPGPVAEVAARVQQSDPAQALAPPGAPAGSDPTSEGEARGGAESSRATLPTPSDPTSAEAAGEVAASADPDASAAGPGDTGAASTAGHEPPDVEAQTAGAAASTPGETTGRGPSGEAQAAAPADTGDTGDLGPVVAWCRRRGLQVGTARLDLARSHADDFGPKSASPLRNSNDLMALRGEPADRAIAYLAAQFTDAGEPKGWDGGGS